MLGAAADQELVEATAALEVSLPRHGEEAQAEVSVHPPVSKRQSTAVNVRMLAATLGVMATSVAAGGGMLDNVWRRACHAGEDGAQRHGKCGAVRRSAWLHCMCKLGGYRRRPAAPFGHPRSTVPETWTPAKLVSARCRVTMYFVVLRSCFGGASASAFDR